MEHSLGNIVIDEAPEDLQVECVDLQSVSNLKTESNSFPLLDFYKNYFSQERYPSIHRHTVFMTSLFGSTYLSKQVFTRMKHVKCVMRPQITDRHLESSLHVATLSIVPDIGSLVHKKQCQVSHCHLGVTCKIIFFCLI
jgi:hypothetical protein